ncbi:MAG: radical SAM protein, partial [Planctomycetota bacterium]
GLIRFATRRGAAVNVNTNASLITPAIALRLVGAGLGKLHVSLDTADERLHAALRGGEALGDVLRGIYNVQLARDLLGVSHPVIHTNCVLTRKNLHDFPRLFAFLLEKRKQAVGGDDPFGQDLLPHVIPVGGDGNRRLRPGARAFREFYESVWDQVCRMWDAHQGDLGVAEEERRAPFGFFSSPFLRVEHRGGLEAYVKVSAEGRYGQLALSQHCYVAPTQAAFTPDGNQYRCGSHAVRRVLPIGNIGRQGVFDGIREGIPGLSDLPRPEHCHGCAMATLYINQSVETRLTDTVAEMLKGRPAEAGS